MSKHSAPRASVRGMHTTAKIEPSGVEPEALRHHGDVQVYVAVVLEIGGLRARTTDADAEVRARVFAEQLARIDRNVLGQLKRKRRVGDRGAVGAGAVDGARDGR